MFSSSIFTAIAAVAMIATPIAAKSCKSGGSYCGTSLVNRGKCFASVFISSHICECVSSSHWLTQMAGNYMDHIIEVLQGADSATTETYIDNTLFSCGSGGDITIVSYCENGCSGVGSSDADSCLTA